MDNLSVKLLLDEAKKAKVGIKPIYPKLNSFILEKGNKKRFIVRSFYSGNSRVSALISKEKAVSKRILEDAGINVPGGELIFSTDEKNHEKLKWFLNKYEFPLIMKECNGSLGKNVFIVSNKEQFKKAYKYFLDNKINFIIEKFFKGKDYRILSIKGEIQGVIHRIPANVVGDGKKSIKELIDIKNKDPRRGEKGKAALVKIEIDEVVENLMKKKKIKLSDVPEKGEKIFLRENANISTGGDSIDYTDRCHKNYGKICKKIYKVIPELKIIGVDVITEDISEDPFKIGYCVIEINSRPDFEMHQIPFEGKKRNIAKKILEIIFE